MDYKHIDGCLCYWCNEHRAIDAKRQIEEARKEAQEQAEKPESPDATYWRECFDNLSAVLESTKRNVELYQGNALYWKSKYEEALAERNDSNDEEVHKLTVTCHVLARMLASAYDTE